MVGQGVKKRPRPAVTAAPSAEQIVSQPGTVNRRTAAGVSAAALK